MASPNFDSLVQRLSIPLRDYVASASSNGATYTKSEREELVNEASRVLHDICYSGWAFSAKGDSQLVNSRFTDFIDYSTFTADASGNYNLASLSLQGTVIEVLSLVRNTDKTQVPIVNKQEYAFKLQNTIDQQLSKTNPVAYLNVAAQTLAIRPATADNVSVGFSIAVLRFPNTTLTVGGDDDIEWNPSFYDGLLKIAYAIALYRDGNLDGYLNLMQMQMGLYGYKENILNNPNLKKAIR